jgi:hypothetical protein
MWANGKKAALGSGIPWAVNSQAWAVGDDRTSLNSSGRPTLWHFGRKQRLSSAQGTAFSINNHNEVVGDIAPAGAFLAQIHGNQISLVLLDGLIAARKGEWHIEHAYDIADDGSILAMAVNAGGGEYLVVLKPTE